jgi:predicted nuclease with TOPRIM domain
MANEKRKSKSSSGKQKPPAVTLNNVDLEAGDGITTPTKPKQDPLVISPAPTIDSSSAGGDSSPPPAQSLLIEHNVSTNNGRSGGRARSAGLIFGMSKPIFALVAGSLLLTSGAAAYFLTGWLEIPGLNNQIKALEVQVDRLAGEVDRLVAENDRYESLNDQLNTTIQEFAGLNDQLNMTATHLEGINKNLNATNLQLKDRIEDLSQQNQEYATLNAELNAITVQLANEVDQFRRAIATLILENADLANLSDKLAGLTGDLGSIAEDQNLTIAALELTVTDIVSENTRLADLNNDLTNIASFLSETSAGLDTSLQQVAQFLAGQITANRILVLGSLENTYRQRITNWDCDYRDIFRVFAFGDDYDVVIPAADENMVIRYVSDRVLSELCLDRTDFEQYLFNTIPQEEGLTSNRLMTVVLVYTTTALDYYFPEAGEDGLSALDWADAAYDCQNLANKFVHKV